MKKTSRLIATVLCAALLTAAFTTGCSNNSNAGSATTAASSTATSGSGSGSSTTAAAAAAVSSAAAVTVSAETAANAQSRAEEVLEEVSEAAESEDGTTLITLNGSSADVTGSGVDVDGGTVTIMDAGTYTVTGTLTDGQLIVDAKGEDVTVILENADITCSTSAPIYIYKAESVVLVLPDGTESTLTDGSTYTWKGACDSEADQEPNACLYSKADLTITGTGTLNVDANCNNGITGKDTLGIDFATINITAENNGITGKDSLLLTDAVISVDCGGNGISSSNDTDDTFGYLVITESDVTVNAGEDGIQAVTCLTVQSGNLDITTGNGSGSSAGQNSAKGLKAGSAIVVDGGTISLNCADDAVHSDGSVSIAGGTFTIRSGDDGIHANDTVSISGGSITVTQSYEGVEGLYVEITGGTLDITASDDGINAAGGADQSGFGGWGDSFSTSNETPCITISGGIIYVNAGGDGVDANGNLYVSGGETYVSGPTNSGNGALDYDSTGCITGGIFVAAGASGMAMNFDSSSTQGSILMNYSTSASSAIILTDASGNTLVNWTPDKTYSSVTVSCPGLTLGGTYTLTACGQTGSITLSSLIYGSGSSMGGGRGGNGGNGGMGGGKGGKGGW